MFVPGNLEKNIAYFKASPVDKKEDGTPLDNISELEISEDIRCIKISPDGKTLAAGDQEGHLHIYDLK